jgi:hypothetical protein
LPDTEVLLTVPDFKNVEAQITVCFQQREHINPNVLTQKRGKSPLIAFLLQFHQPLVYILLSATVITAGQKAKGVLRGPRSGRFVAIYGKKTQLNR